MNQENNNNVFCNNCGTQLNGNEQFCANCGNKIITNIYKTANKKNKIYLMIIGIIIVFCLFLGSIKIYRSFSQKKDNTNHQENNKENILSDISTEILLYQDYKNNKINIDKYVQQLLYYTYDQSLLDDKYRSNVKSYDGINYIDFIEKNYESLSKDTLKYFWKKINLEDLTFELNKENNDDSEVSILNYLIPKVNASSKTTNLNKVYLSPNKKFLIWYTTTGDSAVNLSLVEELAVQLEKSIDEYEDIVSSEFIIDSVFLKKDERYDKQIEILKKYNIDEKYMKESLPVYLYNYGEDSCAIYTQNKNVFYNTLYKIFDGDHDFSNISFPYILLQPKHFLSQKDYFTQVANHELFHHFQAQIIRKKENAETFINEATAQWASATISEIGQPIGYTNDWSARFLKISDDIFGIWTENYGESTGYAFFPYLFHYEQSVVNGRQKILDSIYEKKYLEFLENNSTYKERMDLTKNLILKNLNQDYLNKNYIANTTDYWKLVPFAEISDNYNNSFDINGMGLHYFKINLKQKFNVNLKCLEREKENENLQVFLIYLKDGVYIVKEYHELISSTYLNSLETESDSYYIVIANTSLIKGFKYSIEINQEEIIEEEIIEEEIQEEPEEVEGTVPNDKEFITDFKNYKIKGSSILKMSVSGMNVTTEMTYEGVVDELHQKEYIKSSTSVMGMNVDTEIYTDFDLGVSYTKQPYTTNWIKDTGATKFIDLGNVLNKLKDHSTVILISPNKYKVYFSNKDIKNLVGASSDIDLNSIKGDIEAIVYVKNGYISKIEYDFSNLADLTEEYKMTLEFYDYNEAGDVNIPNAAVNNSVEY